MKKHRLVTVTALVSLIVLVSLVCAASISAGFDFTAQPPLGRDYEFIEGIDEEAKEKILAEMNRQNLSKEEQLYYIRNNLEYYFDPEVFGRDVYCGSHYEETENGKYLHVFLTDLSCAPKIDNSRVIFKQGKYTYRELDQFAKILWEYFDPADEILLETGIPVNKYILHITLKTGTDVSIISDLIPEDSYYIEFADDTVLRLA